MKSPFKFLDSYTKDDREIFFGRDSEIEELYQRVFDSKLLLVYGVSGTGKSSLIHCGLANKFQETDWLPLVIRRGGNIIESMASAVSSASLTKQQNKFASPIDFKKVSARYISIITNQSFSSLISLKNYSFSEIKKSEGHSFILLNY